MSVLGLVLVILLVFLVLGGGVGYYRGYPYGGYSVGLGTVLIIILLVLLLGGRL